MSRPHPDKALLEAARRNYEAISGSQTFCVLFNERMVEEVTPLLQMGLAVYLDKPIVLLVPKGASVPGNLRAMATAVAEFDPEDEASMEAAVQKLARGTGSS